MSSQNLPLSVFEFAPAPAKPQAVLVFLHGVGASEHAMSPLAKAASSTYERLLLRAPLPRGNGGFAWFQVAFTNSGPVINEAEARQSLQLLKNFLNQLKAKRPGVPVFLVGFSQGAIMSLLVELTSPALVAGVICFSGRFPAEFRGDIPSRVSPQESRIWVGHGIHDNVLPVQRGRDIEVLLRENGLRFTYREYPGVHEVSPQMLADAYAWLATQLEATGLQHSSETTPPSARI